MRNERIGELVDIRKGKGLFESGLIGVRKLGRPCKRWIDGGREILGGD